MFEPVNSSLKKLSGYNPGYNPSCNLKIFLCKQEFIRFEPENMYRLAEPGKITGLILTWSQSDHFAEID